MDNMPDFDSMTPEEMMAWMEALAKRQGATEGLVTSGDMDVPEIDPDSVGDIDEPGYIPFGMDPEVWAQKKAKEDAERAERIAAMKAEKTGPQQAVTPPAKQETTAAEPVAAASPLDFLADMAGSGDSPDTSPVPPVMDDYEPAAESLEPAAEQSEALGEEVSAEEVPMEDLFADLSGAVVPEGSGDMDWLANLGQSSSDLPNFESLDFGSLEALDQPPASSGDSALEWLESLVSSDSDQMEPVAEDELAEASALDDMTLEDESDILEDSAVSAVLNDPMEWLADFSDTEPMEEQEAQQAEASHEVLAVSDDLDAFFDRIQSGEEEPGLEIDLNAPMGQVVDAGLIDFGGTPDFSEPSELGVDLTVGSALTQGAEVAPEEVKAWMDSLLDHGIQRTDVSDEELEEIEPTAAELPSWLVEQVGMPPTTEEMLAASNEDLPDWLTAPVSDQQNAEFEEMFNQITAGQAEAEEEAAVADTALPEFESHPAPLDTGVIRVQMNDPWVEAFELERDERLSDTGKLAAWYESAAHEVQAARQSDQMPAVTPPPPPPSAAGLKAAQLPPDEELPHGEPQSMPTWLGGSAEEPAEAPAVPASAAGVIEPQPAREEELPDWLRAAQLESDEMAEVPSWLTDSLSTDEFEILQLGEKPKEQSATSIQDEPTTPVPVQPTPTPALTTPPQPITQRPTSELPRVAMASQRAPREHIPVHEAGSIINQARASQKMGDIHAMLDSYERLIRSEVALEDVEADMERVAKDAVNKTNPAVLRVYGDVLLRRGKLQQALDTYRAALNLL